MVDYSKALAVAVDAAREAGALLRDEFHRPGGPRGNRTHAEIDEEAERRIRRRLLSELPWGFRGEELGYTAGRSEGHIWLVDPHDGTSLFLSGRRGSAVSIAALRDGVPVLGVVFAFCYPDDEGDLICWAEGCGPIQRNGRPVRAGALKTPADGDSEQLPIVLLWAGADRTALAAMRCVHPSRYAALPSIAYRLALTAVGEAVAAVAINGPLGWDYAGGHALVLAAGGVLLNQRGDPVAYTQDGQSYASRCFGGNATAAGALWAQDWGAVFSEAGRVTRASFTLTKPQRGRAISDCGRLARAQGCLLGQLAGDSLGSLVEFESSESIHAAYPDGLRDLADGGVWGILAGQPTDDSELALMLARTLVRERAFDPQVMLNSYAYWLLSRPFDVGSTISAALEAAVRSRSAEQRLQSAAEAARTESQANGSLMRVSPLGIFAAGRPAVAARLARSDSALTHPHPVCQDACVVFTAAIAMAVAEGGSAPSCYHSAVRAADSLDVRPEVKEALAEAVEAAPSDYLTYQGWVLNALQNAFYQLLHAPDLEAGIVASVMAGGDTDTNAAIAGALLGAVHGRQAVPRRWTRAILSCRPLRSTKTAHPRPIEFWPVDALELAEALLLAGESATGDLQ
jgi:ADP-ribosylglycohydrolase/fructose-1,6-bisphosphatase/inositol monophosphatase family enzyme